jgi:TRAP-type C4-dicarboxylate transport system permease small subunit
LYYSIVLVGIPSVTSQKSPAMRLPMAFVYAAMPIGLTLMLLQSFVQLAETLAGKKGAN